ncbi:ammonium transporter [Pisolithus microcarpus]|nr:ammonium transporter [Pisolithus microcarpus]
MTYGDSSSKPSLLESTFDRGDISFIILAGAMAFFMIPGLAFLYSGLSRRKSALSLIMVVCASNTVCIVQWYLWGYSLAFSPTATNGFIGNFCQFWAPERPRRFYQMEFACVTIGILVGAIAERGRLLPVMVFTFLWMTLVYCPLACWAWNVNGWGYKWGVLDFADKELINFRPHNVAMVNLGTFILWFGWLGFNGGCAYGANLRAIMAIWNSMISPAFAGIVWCLLDYRLERKYSMVGFCSGSIAGLVATTAAAGYLQPWASVIMGIVSGVGGIIGLLFNGIFASRSVIALDGVNVNVNGGWVDHNWKQLYIQFDYICAASGYTFAVTAIIAKAIDMIPGLQLRTTPEGESVGLDEVEIGEYANDYVEVRRHFYDLSALGEHKGDPSASDLFVSGDKNGSSNLRKSVHRLRLEDSTQETIHEKNVDTVIELQPTSECQ